MYKNCHYVLIIKQITQEPIIYNIWSIVKKSLKAFSLNSYLIQLHRYHEHQSDQFSWYLGAQKNLLCKNFKQISKLNFNFFSDVLVDIIRQLTDITDKDREIVKKLEKASYRRFAFEQVKNLQCILHHKLF